MDCTIQREVHDRLTDHAAHGFYGGYVNELTLAGLTAMHESYDCGICSDGAERRIGVTNVHAARGLAFIADQRAHAAERCKTRRVPCLVSERAFAAIHAHRNVNDVGLCYLHLLVAKA